MNFEDTLLTAYTDTTQCTLQCWRENPTAGRALPIPYHQSRLGISTGNVFHITGWLAEFYTALAAYAREDPRLDLVPQDSLHFTFLALATSLFDETSDIPQEINSLFPLYDTYVHPVTFCIRHVRLLPLHGALLLAGIPNIQSFKARRQFAEAVLNSAWSPWLNDRYKHHEIPPVFWHTTIARYEAEFLPERVRAVYHRFAAEFIPEINMGRPLFVASTYNWSHIQELSPLKG